MGIPAALGVAASGLPALGDQANAVLTGTISAVGPTRPFAFRGPMNLSLYASINTTLTTTAASLAATVASATGLAAGNAIKSANVPPGTTTGALAGANVTLAPPPITLMGSVVGGTITGLASTTGLLGATISSDDPSLTIPANTTVTGITQVAVAPSLNSAGVPGIVATSNQITGLPTIQKQQPFTFTLTANSIAVTGADAAAVFTGGLITFDATVQLERSFDGGATWIVCNIGNAGALAQWVDTGPISLTFGEPERNVLYRFNCLEYTSGVINYRVSQTGGAAESLAIGPLTGG